MAWGVDLRAVGGSGLVHTVAGGARVHLRRRVSPLLLLLLQRVSSPPEYLRHTLPPRQELCDVSPYVSAALPPLLHLSGGLPSVLNARDVHEGLFPSPWEGLGHLYERLSAAQIPTLPPGERADGRGAGCGARAGGSLLSRVPPTPVPQDVRQLRQGGAPPAGGRGGGFPYLPRGLDGGDLCRGVSTAHTGPRRGTLALHLVVAIAALPDQPDLMAQDGQVTHEADGRHPPAGDKLSLEGVPKGQNVSGYYVHSARELRRQPARQGKAQLHSEHHQQSQ